MSIHLSECTEPKFDQLNLFSGQKIVNISTWPPLTTVIFSSDIESSIDSDLPVSGYTVYTEMSIVAFISKRVQE